MGGGASSPTCLLCTHNGYICLSFPGANRDIGATFLFHGIRFFRIPAKPGWHRGKSSTQISAHPSPTTAHLPLSRSGQATHLSFSLGMALGAGSDLKPGGTKRQWGEDGSRGVQGPPARPEHPSPSRAGGGGGSLPGRSGKWPMGPGWPVTRGATSGPRRRVGTQGGGGPSTPPETLAGPLPPWGPPAASVFPSTPPRSPLLSRPTRAPRADASGDPATRPRPTPTRARPDPTRALQEFSPAAQSGSPRQGPHPKPSPRQAGRQAGGTSRGWRQEAEASGKPGGGRRRRAERAAVAGSAPAPYTALAAEPAAPAPG